MIDVPGDGNCQYHAVREALLAANFDFNLTADELRQSVAIQLMEYIDSRNPFYLYHPSVSVVSTPNSPSQTSGNASMYYLFEDSLFLDSTRGRRQSFQNLSLQVKNSMYIAFCKRYANIVGRCGSNPEWGNAITLNVIAAMYDIEIQVLVSPSDSFELNQVQFIFGKPLTHLEQQSRRTIRLLLDDKHY